MKLSTIIIAVLLFFFLGVSCYGHENIFNVFYQSNDLLGSQNFPVKDFSIVRETGYGFDRNRDFLKIGEKRPFLSPLDYAARFAIIFAGSLPISTLLTTTTFFFVPRSSLVAEPSRTWIIVGTGLSVSAVLGIADLVVHLVLERKKPN